MVEGRVMLLNPNGETLRDDVVERLLWLIREMPFFSESIPSVFAFAHLLSGHAQIALNRIISALDTSDTYSVCFMGVLSVAT